MVNSLNSVKIESTFRINAGSAVEAAEIAASNIGRDVVSVVMAYDEDTVFIVKTKINTSTYYDVVFVDVISDSKYRVESGSLRFGALEYILATGGDAAVNKIGYYAVLFGKENEEVLNTTDYNAEIAHWVAVDLKGGTPGHMEGYIKNKFKKVIMVNGVFQAIK